MHLDLQANLYHVHHVLVMQLHYFRYDQKLMRPHFLRRVEEGRMTPFPAKQIQPPKAVNKTKVKLHVFAGCQKMVKRRWRTVLPTPRGVGYPRTF